MFKIAGQLAGALKNSAPVKRLVADGGGDMLRASVPGGLLTGIYTTLATGNPIAGLTVGAADVGLGVGAGKLLKKYAPDIAGKYRNYVSDETLQRYSGAGRIPKDQLSRVYEPSWQANAVNLAGSVAAPMLIEPLFYPQQQTNTNQSVTQQQQLGQQEMLNQMYQAQTADGTLYQTQGLPYRSTGQY